MKSKIFLLLLVVILKFSIYAQKFHIKLPNYDPTERRTIGFNLTQNQGGACLYANAHGNYLNMQHGALVRFNNNGDTLWTRNIINPGVLSRPDWSAYQNTAIVNSNGEVFVGMVFSDPNNWLLYSYDFIFKYDNSGNLVQKDSIFSAYASEANRGIISIPNSPDYLFYYSMMSFPSLAVYNRLERRNSGSNVLWTVNFEPNARISNVRADVSGNTFLLHEPPSGITYFEKYDSNGNLIYSLNTQTLMPGVSQGVTDYYPTADSSVVLAHHTVIYNDMLYFAKLNKNGQIIDSIQISNIEAARVVVSGNRVYGMYSSNNLFGITVMDLNLNILTNYPGFTFPGTPVFNFSYPYFLESNFCGGLAGFYNSAPPFNGMSLDGIYSFDSLFTSYPHQLAGKSILEGNNDCTLNNGDLPIGNRLIKATNNSNYSYFALSDNSGNYSIDMPSGSFTISENVFQNKFSKCPQNNLATMSLAPPNVSYNLNFYDSIIPNLNDAQNVNFYNNVFAGWPSYYTAIIINKGSNTINSNLRVVKDPRLTFISSDIPPNNMNGDTLYFPITNLPMDSLRYLNVQFMVDTAITDQDTLSISSFIAIQNDLTPMDNYDTVFVRGNSLGQRITADNPWVKPNHLQVSEPLYYDGQNELIYKMKYVNYSSKVVKDLVMTEHFDKKHDISTLRILGPKKVSYSSFNSNDLNLSFNNINLPSMGEFTVLLSIYPSSSAHAGDTIKNKVSFFADFNPEIHTNQTLNILTKNVTIGIPEHNIEKSKGDFVLYPNPSEGWFIIKSASFSIEQVKLYDMLGKLLREEKVGGKDSAVIDASDLSGVYIIEIKSGDYSRFQKIIIH